MTMQVTKSSSKNEVKDDYYENMRGMYHSVSMEVKDATMRSVYVDDVKKIFEKTRFNLIPKSDEELMRIGYFLEDQRDFIKENMQNYSIDSYNTAMEELKITTWIKANYKRNREFFSRYFDWVPKDQMAMPSQEEEEEEEILEKVPTNEVASFKPSDPVELEPIEREPISRNIIDQNLLDAVLEIQESQSEAIKRRVEFVINSVGNLNLTTKEGVVATLGENLLLKQIISAMYANLEVESPTTVFTLKEGTTDAILKYQEDKIYDIEDLKKGLAHSLIKIRDLKKMGVDAEGYKVQLAKAEVDQKTTARRLSDTADQLIAKQKEMVVLTTIPKISDAKLLYSYVAWKELDENNKPKIYYLGTKDEEPTKAGTYFVANLIKTLKRGEAIKFADESIARLQIDKMERFYAKISKVQKISLDEHVKKAYLFQIMEYENKAPASKPKLVE